MHFLATCSPGVESLVRSELERQWITITYWQDRLVAFDGDMHTLAQANIWLRTANRVYIELDRMHVTSFDALFSYIEAIDWTQWIPWNTPILVSATSSRSILTHTPTIQSIGKKAIIRRLTQGSDDWHENELYSPVEIFFLLVGDEMRILLNTSGDALHKRGYRTEAGEAPIKESLAASLILFSGWKFRTPLYDPMCGSGTLLIEAAMIARNIAPGLVRDFDYLHFPWFDSDIHTKVLQEARTKIFAKSYDIFWSDIDMSVLSCAMDNAQRAGVGDTIKFSQTDFREVQYINKAHLVTNPPYWKRLSDDNLDGLYDDLEKVFLANSLTGGVITTVENFPKNKANWTKKNLMNGAEKCQFWRKLS